MLKKANGGGGAAVRRVSLLLALSASVIGLAADGAKGDSKPPFDIPASLLHRMDMDYIAACEREVGVTNAFDWFEHWVFAKEGYTNALEIASRPRGEMTFCDDLLSEKERESLWPFEVEAFEKTLESKMVRDKDGRFRLLSKYASGVDKGLLAPVSTRKAAHLEPSGDEGLELSNPTFRWVNDEVEKWATAQMDATFKRLDAKTFMKLCGLKAPPEEAVAWRLDEKGHEYFVIERRGDARNSRYYMYSILLDGQDKGTLVAAFDSFPNRKEASAFRTCVCDGAALHNLAVLEWRHRINALIMNPWSIQLWLETAKEWGIPTAEANLRVLRQHIPEVLQERKK